MQQNSHYVNIYVYICHNIIGTKRKIRFWGIRSIYLAVYIYTTHLHE